MIRCQNTLIGLAICMICSPPIIAQTHATRDSLLEIALHDPADTARVKGFMDVGKMYLGSSPDTAIYYIDQGLTLAEKIRYKPGIVRCRINKAVALYDLGQYDVLLELCLSVIPMCEDLQMGKELVATYNLMGNTWNLKGNVWLAVDCFEKCLAAMKTAEVPKHFPVVVNSNIAIIYNNLKLYDKAIIFASGSLRLAEEIGDEETVGIASQHLGIAYKGLQQHDKAISYFQRSVDIGRKLKIPRLLATALSNVADMKSHFGKDHEAMLLYEEGLQVAESSGDMEGKVYNLHGLSIVAFSRKQFADAEKFALQALALVTEIKLSSYRQELYLSLSDIALAKGDMKRYIAYRQDYQVIRDTLATEALVHAIQELETKYETEKKEEKINSLQKEKEIQQMRLQQKNSLIAGLGIVALLTILLAVLSWNIFQNRKKLLGQEIQIQEQKIRELEQDRQLQMADAVMQGQEKERTRLARDLHDGLGGMLSGIKQGLVVLKNIATVPESSIQGIGHAIADLDNSMDELRRIARNLMPEALLRFGLKDALEDYCDHLQRTGTLQIQFLTLGMENRLPQETEVFLFRIAQELLNNVVRHANATEVLVQIIRDGHRINLTVEDNGKGFDPQLMSKVQGIGWANIQSRVSYLHGILDIRTAPGEGCSVHIAFETI